MADIFFNTLLVLYLRLLGEALSSTQFAFVAENGIDCLQYLEVFKVGSCMCISRLGLAYLEKRRVDFSFTDGPYR